MLITTPSRPARRGVKIVFGVGFERRLIAFEGEEIIGLVGDDLVGDFDLTSHGVDGHQRAFKLLDDRVERWRAPLRSAGRIPRATLIVPCKVNALLLTQREPCFWVKALGTR